MYLNTHTNVDYLYPSPHERSLLSGAELSKLKASLESDSELLKHSYGREDGHGRVSRMALWKHPGKDISGIIARSEKVAGTMEKVSKVDE